MCGYWIPGHMRFVAQVYMGDYARLVGLVWVVHHVWLGGSCQLGS